MNALSRQRNCVQKSLHSSNFYIKVEVWSKEILSKKYEISKLIAEHCKAFAEGEFVKKDIVAAVKMLYPDKTDLFKSTNFSRNTINSSKEELASSIQQQLTEKWKQFEYFSIPCDESTDIIDNAQFADICKR